MPVLCCTASSARRSCDWGPPGEVSHCRLEPLTGPAEWAMPLPGSDLATKPLDTLYFVPPAQHSFRPFFFVALVTTIYMPFFS